MRSRLQEVHDLIEPLLDYASQRNLPTAALGDCTARAASRRCWTRSFNQAWSAVTTAVWPVFYIKPGKHSVAAFYRNSAIHWFVNRAIIELAVLVASRAGSGDAIDRVRMRPSRCATC